MRFKGIIFMAVIGMMLVWIAYLSFQDAKSARDFEQTVRMDRDRKKNEVVSVVPASPKLDVRSPPKNMVQAKVRPEGYWFVGKYENGPGVEIPFRPGRQADPPSQEPNIKQNPGYVGPDSCRDCHQDIYDTFILTGHAKTARPVNGETIDGCFASRSMAQDDSTESPADAGSENPCSIMRTSDPNVHFEMLAKDGGHYQRVQFYDWQFEVPMQIIMGSSKLAQTYLYWHGDELYQNNVTHVTKGDQWANSPGYIDGDAAYARPVPERCMDCHTTYFDFRGSPNRYTPNSVILGVSCERCHGPGKEHIEYHQENPNAVSAVAITNPEGLTRQQQLDICGQCHAGTSQLKGSAMRFRPGDALADFYHEEEAGASIANTVHSSNQLSRLAESECYINSEMTCSDCHHSHEHERDEIFVFSERCLACHEEESCGMHGTIGLDLKANCIDCHMPSRPTKKLQLKSIEGDIFPPLRDHKIRIDQEATKAFLGKERRVHDGFPPPPFSD